jgi:polyisoprenoid-binding protein YceI
MSPRLLCLPALALALPSIAAQDVYINDPAHTAASFEIGHQGVSWIRGRFNAVEAKIVLDRAAKQGTIDAVIKTSTLDTGHEVRDRVVRSEEYLNVEKFPTMTFKSSKLKFDGENLVGAEGDLTLAGVTKPVSIEIPFFKCVPNAVRKTELCGADVRTMIRRSEFGIKRGANAPMADEVKIAIQIEAYKQQ